MTVSRPEGASPPTLITAELTAALTAGGSLEERCGAALACLCTAAGAAAAALFAAGSDGQPLRIVGVWPDEETLLAAPSRPDLTLPVLVAGAIAGLLDVRPQQADAALLDRGLLDQVAPMLALVLQEERLSRQLVREQGRARFLADVGQVFAGVLDPEQVLHEVAARAVDVVADWCVVYILDPERQVLHIRAVYHPDAARAAIVRAVFEREPVRVGEGVAGQVVQDRRPRIFPRFDEASIARLAARDDPAYLDELRRVRSWACLPLVARDEAVGALVIATAGERELHDDDLVLARGFADRAALAIDNARLYTAARRQVDEARYLADVTTRSAAARTPDDLVHGLAEQAMERLGDGCAVFLARPERESLPALSVAHRNPALSQAIRDLISGQILRFDEPLVLALLRAGLVIRVNGREGLLRYLRAPEIRQVFEDFSIDNVMAVGLGGTTGPLGTLVCFRHGAPEYTEADERLLRQVADRAGAMINNALLLERLERERRRLSGLIEHLPEGVVIAAVPDGRLVLGNPAAEQLTGRTVHGQTSDQYVREYGIHTAEGEPFPAEALPLVRALAGETVHGRELWVQQPDGTQIPLLVSAAPLRDPSGQVVEAVAVFQDITAIKEAQRIKDEWLTLASHELRTPITSLRGFVQLLERQAQRGGRLDLSEALPIISRQTERLTTLVNDLLDVSRIQGGRLVLQPRPCDLGELVKVAAARAADTDPETRGRLQVALPEQPVTGTWDPERLDQVFTNLCTNALKYDPAHGPVTVRVHQEGAWGIVEVADQGIGIPADDLPRLFEPFARARNAARVGVRGIGLGLYITRDIVQRHGGRITVTSSEGQGSAFRVELPL